MSSRGASLGQWINHYLSFTLSLLSILKHNSKNFENNPEQRRTCLFIENNIFYRFYLFFF